MGSASLGRRHTGIALLAGYLVVYAGTLFAMHRVGGFAVAEALPVFVVLGVGFSLAAWLMTIGARPLDYAIPDPRKELAAVGVCLVLVAVFTTWGLEALHRYVPSDPQDSVAILICKLVVFVAIPAVAMRALFGYDWRRLMPVSARARHLIAMFGMSVILLAFQALLGRGLKDIVAARPGAPVLLVGIPVVFVWLALEVGVVEEFFFRVLLQTRLAAALKSELGGIVLMALIFGLVHAPGLYLRTGITLEGLPPHPSLLMALGYSIVITSVAGFFVGVLWARTRNFAVVVVIHAVGDLLPNLLPTLRSLHILS